jgi:hypothetical protein
MRALAYILIAACSGPPREVAPTRGLPLAFEERDGGFVARSPSGTVWLDETGATIGHVRLSAGQPRQIRAIDPQRGRVHYLLGRDETRWRTSETYGAVKYEYDGIDLIFHGRDGRLEYDFSIAPGADPDRIALAASERIELDGDDAVIGGQRHHRPVAYQNGAAVDVAYVLRDDHTLGFAVGDYDRSRELVIDPVLTYSTFLGGGQGDSGGAVAVDPAGNVYLTGTTQLDDFPTKNPFQPMDKSTTNNAFVAKLDASGSLVYATYLGGSGGEVGNAIGFDPAGDAYVGGTTLSTDFPVKNAAQATLGGMTDGFVAVLAPDGSSLEYATYLGGATSDALLGLAVDKGGNVYACGVTNGGFPTTTGSLQKNFGGNQDGWIVKLASIGQVTYATYLGGAGFDSVRAIAIDATFRVYVTGQTDSAAFPTLGAPQNKLGGGIDAFVTVLAPDGASLVYSTYLGGAGDDTGSGIAVDDAGRAYVAGATTGSFPVTAGAVQTTYGGGSFDMFAARVAAAGIAVDYATYLGGSGNDQAAGIALDSANHAFVAGSTDSADFPLAMASQAFGGMRDATVSELDSTGGSLAFSTFLGGSDNEGAAGVAVDTAGAFYVTGSTASADFPIVGGEQPAYGGGVTDVFFATNRGAPARDGTPPGDDPVTNPGGKSGGCCDAGGPPPEGLIVAILLGIPRRRRAL